MQSHYCAQKALEPPFDAHFLSVWSDKRSKVREYLNMKCEHGSITEIKLSIGGQAAK